MGFRYRGGLRSKQVGWPGSWYSLARVDSLLPTAFQAFRRDGGTMFPYRHSVIHRNNRLHHSYFDNEACSSLCCSVCVLSQNIIGGRFNCGQLLNGPVILGIHLFLDVDIQHFRPPTVETCCCARVYQCVFATRKHSWLVGPAQCCPWEISTADRYSEQLCVAEVLGSDLRPLLRYLRFNQRALHCDVFHLETSAF